MKYIIEIDDDEGCKGRKIYITSWGTSAWRCHALLLSKDEADKKLQEYLKINNGETGRVKQEIE